MSLVTCPECRHAVSTNAVACPNCGYTLPVVEPVVVVEPEPNQALPKWVLIPAAAVIAMLFVVIIVLMRNNSDNANTRNVNVELSQMQKTPNSRETSVKTVESEPPTQISVPSSSTTVNPPPVSPAPISSAPVESSRTTVPATAPTSVNAPDKGLVKIDAKVAAKNGNIQSVKNEKFYLLDKDVETILNEADLEPIEYNSLMNSFGLSVMYPDRYAEFNREALEAIKKHIKYSGLTDATGKASLKDVKPDSYYLFGITKSKTGFAVWSAPVSINTGENILNLSPASFNEISE
jgi:hypothetical protein